MKIDRSNERYEAWLASRLPLIPKDLDEKHKQMALKPFPFLRATFYRWSQLWPKACPELANVPRVLGVGDLHIENFGTWRDCDGRLIWGVNDFDEACWLPYTNDLVRLAVSADLRKSKIPCSSKEICDAILDGYRESLEKGGRPFVLVKEHQLLRELARKKKLGNPLHFWEELEDWPDVTKDVPIEVRKALTQSLPKGENGFRVVHRQAGLGSLGRRRFTAIVQWNGGLLAREAKELTSSAWYWYDSNHPGTKLYYSDIVNNAVRVPDPSLEIRKPWVIRRLAHDCSKIEFSDTLTAKESLELLFAMGWETANIHLGARGEITKVKRDLARQPSKWLRKATKALADVTNRDWMEWASKNPNRHQSKE